MQYETIKLCVISDLHNNKKNVSKLCEKMKAFGPDLILIPGDMVNKHSRTQKNAIVFFEKIKSVCPVFYSLGNHEERMRSDKPASWKDYTSRIPNEICFLDNTSVTATIHNKNICISGLSLPEEFYCKGKLWDKKENLPEIDHTSDMFHILLAHNPEYAEWYTKYRPDFVVSGHLHGGLVRIPLLGGLISPRLRIPKEDAGAYRYSFGTLFISRGLGSHTVPLRFFNRTEINFIVLCGENRKKDGER